MLEDNFFGEYIRTNVELREELHGLPIEGRRNTLDKNMRISNGINSRLSKVKNNRGLWLCKTAIGYGALIRQLTDFPFVSKIDELDSVESADRLLIKNNSEIVLIADESIFSSKQKRSNQGLGSISEHSLKQNNIINRYSHDIARRRRGLHY